MVVLMIIQKPSNVWIDEKLHRVPEGDTSAADTGGAGRNTRNDYHTPPRGIRYSWQFMDAEESVHIRLEKVSEKDIGR